MKIIKIITILLLLLTFWSCSSEEESILAEAKPYKRTLMYDVNSSNQNIKYISHYFLKYDKLLITDVDSSDYWFNYRSSYKTILRIIPPAKENIAKGIKMLHELLIKWYDDDFIKKHFPYSIILGDTVNTYNRTAKIYQDIYVGSYFIAVKTQDINLMTENQKTRLANEFSNNLWTYINDYNPFLRIDPAFYNPTQQYYGKSFYYFHTGSDDWLGNTTWTLGDVVMWNKIHSVGFIKPSSITYKKDSNNNITGIYSILLPTSGKDLLDWILFLLNTPDSEVQTLVNKYPAMKTKYDCLVKAFTDAGINYRQLGYKPTVQP